MRSGPVDPIDLHIGANLRFLRKVRGLTQTDMGEMLGVSFQAIQHYEKGANRMTAAQLVRVAFALGVLPAALLPQSPEAVGTGAAPSASLTEHAAEMLIDANAANRRKKIAKSLLTYVENPPDKALSAEKGAAK